MKTSKEIFAANQVLTVDIATSLIGKRIQTVYSGYRGQDGDDNFVVGEIKREIYANGKEGEICLFTSEGRNTYIRAHKFNDGVFTCSDSDREVYFVVESIDEESIVPFFEKYGDRTFMEYDLYDRNPNADKELQDALNSENLLNPYDSLNKLREQLFNWKCFKTTERLIEMGEEISEKNPTSWKLR